MPSQPVMVVSMEERAWLISVPQLLITVGICVVGTMASARQLTVSRPLASVMVKSSGTTW